MSSAVFSPCRTWRYTLVREWEPRLVGCMDPEDPGGTCVFVGLNPSTADEAQDDPTIRRCIRFAQDWGFERYVMLNLFAWRATKPTDLYLVEKSGVDIVGPDNDAHIARALGEAQRVVLAWGATAPQWRVNQFIPLTAGTPCWALGLCNNGQPRHPLYLAADTIPEPYDLEVVR